MTAAIPQIFDRSLYLARQAKASAAQKPLLAHVAGDLADRLAIISHQFPATLVIAPAEEPFAEVLRTSSKCGTVTYRKPAENDDLGLPVAGYDAVFSLLDLHCINDVPGYLAQCARSLKPDGLFMACCFAAETLHELREAWLAAESDIISGASLRVAPMIGVREMGSLLQRAALALPVTDSDYLMLRYAEPLALFREVKEFGFANPLIERRKEFTSGRMLAAAAAYYQNTNADADGRVRATLDLLWALAWKPHESQPQPKKPGSATVNLAEVLKSMDKGQ
jgi:SAM-dependent methyltransferase